MMLKAGFVAAFTGALLGASALAQAEELTIATVNNADMIIMQKLAPKWEQATGNKLNWVVLEENVLRQRVTTDIATKGGQFDIITIGSYEAPIWGKQGWLVPLDDLGDDYDYADMIPSVKNGLSYDGKLYAVPFYAESSFTFYRKDLFEAGRHHHAGEADLRPDRRVRRQAHRQVEGAVRLLPARQAGLGREHGLRRADGERVRRPAGSTWSGSRSSPASPGRQAVTYYVENMKKSGPPGATANGHNENRALFATGHCAMWVDATSAAGYIFNPKESQVADKTAFAPAPIQVTSNGSGWFWAWALGIPSSSQKVDAAKSFVKWATSKEYITTVGEEVGWVSAPPGTRKSTYDNPKYQEAAPFAKVVYEAVANADITKPTKDPVPYVGIQYVAIPEFQGIGTTVGQQVAAALAGQVTVEQALADRAARGRADDEAGRLPQVS